VEKITQVVELETEVTDGELDWISSLAQVDQWKIYPEYADVEFGDDGAMIQFSDELAGIVWQGDLPEAPYEMEWQARRVDGWDFFCGLTFPVRSKDECVTLILGGWGGGVVGISSIDGLDASFKQNPSYSIVDFEKNQWYAFKLTVTNDRIVITMDGSPLINVPIQGKLLSLRSGPIEEMAPLSISTWQTDGQVKHLRWRSLK